MKLPELTGGQVRIGVVLEIPDPFSAELSAARKSLEDPVAKIVRPHITVLAPTIVETENVKMVLRHLSKLAARQKPFRIHLRGTGTFRPISDVVFIQVAQGISECEQLEQAVRSGPLSRDLRFNYHPHVTIAHDLPAEKLDLAFKEYSTYDAEFVAENFRIDLLDDTGASRTLGSYTFAEKP